MMAKEMFHLEGPTINGGDHIIELELSGCGCVFENVFNGE